MFVKNKYINQIYTETLNFCKKKGLIDKLIKSLREPEGIRFSKISVDKNGLGVLDAVHCLIDKKRTSILLNEIYKQVDRDHIVIEAGTGTGILSYIASINAKEVYSFEINYSIFKLASNIYRYLNKINLLHNNIFLIHGDARNIKLKRKADIVISENLYTGMFFEKQVEIVKSLKKNIAKNGKFIPSSMVSSFFLVNTENVNFMSKNKLYVVSELTKKPRKMSKEYIYDSINFNKITSMSVVYETLVSITNGGMINSILICSNVFLPSGMIIDRSDTIFMNNDILLTLGYSFKVCRGDKIKIKLSYKYGSDPKDADIILIKA